MSLKFDNFSTILKQNVILTIKSYRNSKMSYNFKYIIAIAQNDSSFWGGDCEIE